MSDIDAVPVPEVWQKIGFSGMFRMAVDMADDCDLDEWEARVPCRLPLGSNGNLLALSIDRSTEPASVIIVENDAAAITRTFTS